MPKILRALFEMIRLMDLRVKHGECPACGKTIFIKLKNNEWSVRCLSCGSAPNSTSLASVINQYVADVSSTSYYIMAKSGPL